jgi:hypothetical protein
MLVLCCLLTTAAFLRYGWHTALGLACGCAVAYLNFHWLKRGVAGLADRITDSPSLAHSPAAKEDATDTGTSDMVANGREVSNPSLSKAAKPSSTGIVLRFLLRYVLMGLAAYAILAVSPASLNGLLAGLFLPVAGIACEAAYEAYVALARGI